MENYASFRDVVTHTEEQRRDFFKLIFGELEGYICISYISHLTKKIGEYYFKYPSQLDEMCNSIDDNCKNLIHAYFGVNLLTKPKREFGNVVESSVAWCDLDTCSPVLMQVTPSIVVQSSANKWQALWRFESPQPIALAEDISRRITYFHRSHGPDGIHGSDIGCWNRSRLFRIPYTPNYKYGDITTAPVVGITSISHALYRASDFNCYPELEAFKFIDKPIPEPTTVDSNEDIDEILKRFGRRISFDTYKLITEVPGEDADWSAILWRLEKECVEVGMTPDETFKIASIARCNKYKRDNRPDHELWTEVKKAFVADIEQHNLAPSPTSTIPEFLTEAEIEKAQTIETFVERYIDWASGVTDASVQYHQAGAFTILSSLMSSNYILPTSFGNIAPNMWFYITADTTITRKSTSLNLAMKLLEDVNDDAIMATDGSVEGILTALMHRPGVSSIYLRDEFTGLLDAMTNKDYMAGMAEAFTKLYDGGSIKRMLRKEEIKVNNPIFIILAGGVKTKTQLMLNEEHINSGFIPRFVFITAEPDPSRIRPVGPPLPINNEARELLLNELFVLNEQFNSSRAPKILASLTPDAWHRYNELENLLTRTALDSEISHLTPVYDRLAKSTLKAAMLLSGAKNGGKSEIVIDLDDIIHAIYYCRSWYKYTSEIVNGIGKSHDERLIDVLLLKIGETKDLGIPRSKLMKAYRLDSKRAELIFSTMEQRGLIRKTNFRSEVRYHEVL